MRRNTRRSRRHTLSYPCWILTSAEPIKASLIDISELGARISVESPDQVPENFELALSANLAVSRQCKIVRRGDHELGLVFSRLYKANVRPVQGRPIAMNSPEK